MGRIARLPLFWRFQLAGWGLLALATFPLKLTVYDSTSVAVALTLSREPLGVLLSCGLRWLYHRFPRHELRPAPLGAVIFFACATAGVIDTLLGRVISSAAGGPQETIFSFGVFCYRATLYAAWSLLYFWINAQRDARERELNLARAETDRREAELQLLRAQVNPHFLFNALNTILATLEPDQARPKRVVEGLAAYLRYSLTHRHDSTVPLGAEYDAALHYLAVEQERFRGELLADCTIDDEARDQPVPGVLIQPLIENAVKYSRQTSEPPYRLRLRVTAPRSETVEIEVANAGSWVEPTGLPGPHGHGLDNIRRRLALLYPKSHHVETRAAGGWVIVKLQLPALAADSVAQPSQPPGALR